MLSSTFFDESRDRMVTLLLPAEKCFQLLGDDLIEHGRFRMARNVLEADVEHRLWCATACAVLHLRGVNHLRKRHHRKIRLERDNATRFVFFLPTSVRSGHGPR